jgi:WD40 repeat protein/serine/threonine protein kinase
MTEQSLSERSIFEAAIEKGSPEERAAYLDQVCGSNKGLRKEVEALLAAHDRLANVRLVATVDEPRPSEAPGTVIGPYKLLQQIGEGGMGTVFMAEQTQPVHRKVALKVIKPGMDSRQVIARFEAERQALALMDHVNVARVLDAGATASGRPYFVMELIHGVPITKYCDDNHLTPRERLELFVPVCQAIQHAHQKGIIHRDIKPSNIMITLYDGKPVPKVIDFGVAKAMEQKLTERTLFTQYGAMVGTLEYMSPEQAEMSALGVDTRSDVYSLGVLLYELLTGGTPLSRKRIREAAYGEILRMIKEEEPPKPSTRLSDSGEALASISAQRKMEPAKLSRLVRGELDWIVMKTLEKDRNRRYETANGLANDVERYLRDEAVQACPPSVRYRLRKFVRRNKRGVIAAGLVLLALVGGVVGTTWQAVRATQAEMGAVLERDEKNRAWQAEAGLHEIADLARDDALQQKAVALAAEGVTRSEADRNRRLLYSADVHLASQVWQEEDGTALQCNELLQSHVPGPGQLDLREFCWRYQWGLMRRGSVVQLSPRWRTAVVAADDRVVTLDLKGNVNSWVIGDGRRPQELTLAGGDLIGATLSQNGEVAAVIDPNGALKIFSTRTGLPKGAVHAPSALLTLKLSADGSFLAGLGKDMHARVWEVASGKELYDYPLAGTSTPNIDLSADGKLLLASRHPSSTSVALFHAGEPEPIMLTNKEYDFARDQGALSADGKLAAVGHAGNFVELYDTTTQKRLGSLRARSGTSRLAFSPDGNRLAVGEKAGLVTVWDVSRQRILRVLKGHAAVIDALGFTSDGRKLVSTDRDGLVHCWDVNDQEESRVVARDRGEINALSYSPDGRWLVDGGMARVLLHDLRSKDQPRILSTRGTRCAVFSPDGQTIAYGLDDQVSLWQVETGRLLCTFPGSPDEIGSMAFSPDGRWLAAGCGCPTDFFDDWPRKIMLFDVKNQKKHRSFATPTQVSAISFSPDGKRLAAAGHDGAIWLWDVASWDEIGRWKGPAHTAYASILFLSDDQLAVGRASGTIDLWDVKTGRLARSLRGHSGCVPVMALSPDRRTLATGSWDFSIKLWDSGTGRELRTLHDHTSWLYALTFSPDGNTLASSGVDGVLRFWEAPPLEAVAPAVAEINGTNRAAGSARPNEAP